MSSQGQQGWYSSIKRWIPGILISSLALFVLIRFTSWSELVAAISSFKLRNLIIAVALSIISLLTRGYAWRALLGDRPSINKSFFIINEGYLLNNLFPFRAGEFARAIFMGQSSGLGPYHVFSTIVLERAFDLAMAAILVLSSLPLALGMEWAKPVATAALGLVAAGLLMLFLAARFNHQVKQWINQKAAAHPFFQKKIVPRLSSLLDGLEALNKPIQFSKAFLGIVASWIIWVATHYVMLRSIAPTAPFWWAAFVDGILALGAAIPSAPASLGVFEAALVGALTLLRVDINTAVAYAVVMHFLNVSITGIFGFWGLMREGRSISGVISQLQSKGRTLMS